MLRAPRDNLFAVAWMVVHRHRNSGGGIVAKRSRTCDPQAIEELVDQVVGENADASIRYRLQGRGQHDGVRF
jgi:hypothetical protein